MSDTFTNSGDDSFTEANVTVPDDSEENGGGDDGAAEGEGDVVTSGEGDNGVVVTPDEVEGAASYVGVDPEYRQAATSANAPLGEPDDMSVRVQEHMERMAQPAPGSQSFADWVKRRRGE